MHIIRHVNRAYSWALAGFTVLSLMFACTAAFGQEAYLNTRFFGNTAATGQQLGNPISEYNMRFSGEKQVARCHEIGDEKRNSPARREYIDTVTKLDALHYPDHRRDGPVLICNDNALQ